MGYQLVLSSFLLFSGATPGDTVKTACDVVSGTFDVGGTRMYYEAAGSGEPILFLHAGVTDCRMWDEQFIAFCRSHRVVRCDLRGFGKTPRGAVPFSHYRDVATLLDSLRILKVRIVAISFGGSVALDFALAYPERVRSLTLIAPAISGMRPSAELLAIDSTEESLVSAGKLEQAADFDVRTWAVGPARQSDQVSAGLQRKVREMQLHNLRVLSPTGATLVPLEPRAFTRLEEILPPTLILVGDKDLQFFRDLSKSASKRIPHATMRVIPDAAHLIPMEKPGIFNSLLEAFLKDR